MPLQRPAPSDSSPTRPRYSRPVNWKRKYHLIETKQGRKYLIESNKKSMKTNNTNKNQPPQEPHKPTSGSGRYVYLMNVRWRLRQLQQLFKVNMEITTNSQVVAAV